MDSASRRLRWNRSERPRPGRHPTWGAGAQAAERHYARGAGKSWEHIGVLAASAAAVRPASYVRRGEAV